MRHINCRPFYLAVIFLAGFLYCSTVGSETTQTGPDSLESEAITIKSKTLEINNELKEVIFHGEVNAKRHDFNLTCQKMIVYYESMPTQNKETGDVESKIKEIIATGQVKINQPQKGEATADKAVFYQNEEKLVLEGKPVVKQGNDFVEGDRITFFLKENRSIVESSEDKKVSAIIFQKSEKSKRSGHESR